MPDYSKYSERNLRNKKPANPEEKAYQEMLVIDVVKRITSKYEDEPKFLDAVALALAQRILKSNNNGNETNDANIFNAE